MFWSFGLKDTLAADILKVLGFNMGLQALGDGALDKAALA